MRRIYFTFLLFVTAGAWMTGLNPAKGGDHSFDLRDIFVERKFASETVRGVRSMKDGIHYTSIKENNLLIKYTYSKGSIDDTLYNGSNFEKVKHKSIYEYQLSSDERFILLAYSPEKIYRHSFKADYFIFDRKHNRLNSLSKHGKQLLASFSPTGKKIAFVRHNNLFLYDIKNRKEKQITFDGEKNRIINGAPDWVYEEEFAFNKAYEWSPDGNYIAYLKFNEESVKEYQLAYYKNNYPEIWKYKYPRAGEENSTVGVHIYEIKNNVSREIDINKENDQYIPRIKWSKTPGQLCILRLNRLQNQIDVILAGASNGNTRLLYTEREDKYISEVSDDYIEFTHDQEYFIIRSEKDGYRHLYLYNMKGQEVHEITEGNYDVDELLDIDFYRKTIYYTSYERGTLYKDVYAVNFDGTGKRRISEKRGTNYTVFSASFDYYINYYTSANQPKYITLHKRNGKKVRVLEDNSELNEKVKKYNFSFPEFITIPVNDSLNLNAFMITPRNFNSQNEHPLFMYVYGGPESQSVKDSWNSRIAWFNYLTNQGYVVACIDNRGTDGRGEGFRKSTYMQLGKLETHDQINAAKYLAQKSYVDESRIGIFGWSYGGYLSLLSLMQGADVFKTGIAVAPVTSWKFYDTVYTERFMRKPSENKEGYEAYAPLNLVDGLKNEFLLIHGTADDNVHAQNTYELTKRMVDKNKDFRMHLYTNKDHSIRGGMTSYHIYKLMTKYILENL